MTSKAKRNELAIVILAGGNSHRMGQDKALLSFDGNQTWLERVVDVALGLTKDVAVVTGPQIRYQDVLNSKVKLIRDDVRDRGPLEGIRTGLLNTSANEAIVLSVDMPTLRTDFYDHVDDLKPDDELVYARGTYFPMRIRNTEAVRVRLNKHLNAGHQSIWSFLKTSHARCGYIPTEWERNRNRPEDRFLSSVSPS